MRRLGQYLFCVLTLIGWQKVHGQSDGGTTSGAKVFCGSDTASGFISLLNWTGLILHWEQSEDNQATWQQIQNTTSTQSYHLLKKTTSYRAIVQDGAFPPDTSTISTIVIHLPGVAGEVNNSDTLCGGPVSGSLALTGTQGTVVAWQYRESGAQWLSFNNTSFGHAYSNLVQTTEYRAVVKRIANCVADTSAPAIIWIDKPTISGTLSGSDTLCYGTPGDTIAITGNRGVVEEWLASADGGKTWSGRQSGGSFYVYPTVTATSIFVAKVRNGICSADTTEPVVIAAHPEVIAIAGPDATIVRRQSVQLGGEGSGAALWQPSTGLSDSLAISPVASPPETTTYQLLVTDTNGCTDSDSVTVFVEIPIPSAITPNDDGVNDFFEIYQVEMFPGNKLQVYNRWGQMVFQSAPYKNEWNGLSMDGSLLPDDTYYYTFDRGKGEKPATGYVLIKR